LASKVKVKTVKFKGHTLKGTIAPLYQLSVNKVRQHRSKSLKLYKIEKILQISGILTISDNTESHEHILDVTLK